MKHPGGKPFLSITGAFAGEYWFGKKVDMLTAVGHSTEQPLKLHHDRWVVKVLYLSGFQG